MKNLKRNCLSGSGIEESDGANLVIWGTIIEIHCLLIVEDNLGISLFSMKSAKMILRL